MKNRLKYIFIVLVLGLPSCNDWLDVKPKGEYKKEQMFESIEGFRGALIGTYINLKEDKLFGYNLTSNIPEFLVGNWNVDEYSEQDNVSLIGAIKEHDYTARVFEDEVSKLYLNMYNVIANLNEIINNIDDKKSLLGETEYNIIKGEALGLRAFCHFEILRLFGDVPSVKDMGVSLAYVTTVSKFPHQRYTFDEYAENIKKDLLESELLFKESDPLFKYSISDVNDMKAGEYMPKDDFFTQRVHRMNYYSVKAIQARLSLYIGNKSDALKYAKILINAENPDGTPKFRLGENSDFGKGDYIMSPEHILSFENYKLYEMYESNYEAGRLFRDEVKVTDNVFEGNTTDSRYTYLWTNVDVAGRPYFINKKYFFEEDEGNKKGLIPIIRLSEMYLIAIECSELSEANLLYKEFMTARNCDAIELTDLNFINELVKEYRKEFYAEGQLFYTYKRLNLKNVLWYEEEWDTSDYVLPLPKQEPVN